MEKTYNSQLTCGVPYAEPHLYSPIENTSILTYFNLKVC